MKARFLCEIDMAASIAANLQFLANCKEEIDKKIKRLRTLEKTKKNPRQIDLEDAIRNETTGD